MTDPDDRNEDEREVNDYGTDALPTLPPGEMTRHSLRPCGKPWPPHSIRATMN